MGGPWGPWDQRMSFGFPIHCREIGQQCLGCWPKEPIQPLSTAPASVMGLALLLLLGLAIDTCDKRVITVVRLKCQLLLWFAAIRFQLVDLHSKDCLRRGSGVDTASLDGNDHPTIVLQEV